MDQTPEMNPWKIMWIMLIYFSMKRQHAGEVDWFACDIKSFLMEQFKEHVLQMLCDLS